MTPQVLSRMRTAIEQQILLTEQLCARHQVSEQFENDELERVAKDGYRSGLERAMTSRVMAFLESKYPTQQAIASLLGKADRSSISHFKRSGKIPSADLAVILNAHPDELIPILNVPKHDWVCFGFAQAITEVRRCAPHFADTNDLSAQEFCHLISVLSSSEWRTAQVRRDQRALEALAQRFVAETNGHSPIASPQRLVRQLQVLIDDWGDWAIIGLTLLHNQIPPVP